MFNHGRCGGPRWARFGHRHGGGGGGGFGIRRPLRFLAHKLELSEEQVQEAAVVLDALKTERAQAAVDDRRAHALFAEAVMGESFGADKAGEGARQRAETAERLNKSVVASLEKLHALLEPDQRKQLSTLLRTGPLSV